jgi:hypothetical protein
MEILEALDRTRDETLRYFSLTGPALDATYGPGKWSVRYLLHHLADSELVLAERIRRIVSERRKVLWAFDQEDWARQLDYDSMPLELSRDIYAATRAGTRHLVATCYLALGNREWDHSEMGVRTLKMEMDKVAEHNEHHLSQIRTALKQVSGSSRK